MAHLSAAPRGPAREHRILHEVGRDAILIVRILHKAMDVERHL
jgi:plasmid stabilization system protein ParE